MTKEDRDSQLHDLVASYEEWFKRHRVRCDDCGRFMRPENLEQREPALGGCRCRKGYGCWPDKKNP